MLKYDFVIIYCGDDYLGVCFSFQENSGYIKPLCCSKLVSSAETFLVLNIDFFGVFVSETILEDKTQTNR